MQWRNHSRERCIRRLFGCGTGEAPPINDVVRVLMLSFYFQPAYSGSAVQAYNLSRGLLKRNVMAELVSANLTGSPTVEVDDALRIYRIPVCRSKSLQIPSFTVSLLWHLWKHRREFDIVHAHGTYQHSIASIACRMLGKKAILKIAMGNSDIAFRRQGRCWGRVNRFLVKRFDRYIATSREVYRECLSNGLEPSRVLLIPNGVDVSEFRPAASDDERRRTKRELGLPDTPIVCFVGILDERKNVDGVLRIWRSAFRRGAIGHLVLVGPEPTGADGTSSRFSERMKRFVADEGLEMSVTFAGRQSDVSRYLQCADVFLFPSRREGMPNVVLEAMASGLACIASAIGGSEDLIDNGRSGYLFPLDDEEGMAVAVASLLSNPDAAREFGRVARQFVADRYGLEATADRYVQLYRELLEELKSHKPLDRRSADEQV